MFGPAWGRWRRDITPAAPGFVAQPMWFRVIEPRAIDAVNSLRRVPSRVGRKFSPPTSAGGRCIPDLTTSTINRASPRSVGHRQSATEQRASGSL